MSSPADAFCSVFSEVWDVVVLGGGYAGYAAATTLHAQGKRVLLVDRAATPLWESAWAFSGEVGRSEKSEWKGFAGQLYQRKAAGEGWIDGAIAQVVASHELRRTACPTLFYATPVAVDRDDRGHVISVTVAAKSELRVLTARQWIDATEAGELQTLLAGEAGLSSAAWRRPAASRQIVRIFLRRSGTEKPDDAVALPFGEVPGAQLRLEPGHWENEYCLTLDLPAADGSGAGERPWSAWVPALRSARTNAAGALQQAIVTHGSVVPMPVYAGTGAAKSLAGNVVLAIPGTLGANTLAARFEAGLAAVEQLRGAAAAAPSEAQAIARPPVFDTRQTADVVVAGVGTGGAIAAISAARAGADTLAFDPLPFAGGIGTGGGIHSYYFGVKGGLQEELDARTRAVMPLFGASAQQSGFHPDAKKIILDQMLHEAGVCCLAGAALFGVQADDTGYVRSAWVATETGPVSISAAAWIDGTGDADLAAGAGARFDLGRGHDGQLHAYSQSSGRAGLKEGLAKIWPVNFDAGFVDPTDAQDLTRARLLGTEHYLQAEYTPIERPTYIAPALGLRQGRQVVTDYVVTLADLIERRTFDDAIGLTGCHYDNHAIDYEFESDEAMFWVWCCRQWRSGRTGGQMPYRMMLPTGVENCWVACRGAGVSVEAHHSLRMQRDLQRLGEVAGIAAAMAVSRGGASRKIDRATLQERLVASGALSAADLGDEDSFGRAATAASCEPTPGNIRQWLAETEAAPCTGMYRLMRHAREDESVRRALAEWVAGADAGRGFRAASILALWADPSAEPRLRQGVREREYGFDGVTDGHIPERSNRLVPHWLVAAALLRACGTPACLADLAGLAADPALAHNARTAIAITLESIASRHALSAEDRQLVVALLRRLLDTPSTNAAGHPQRRVMEVPAAEPAVLGPIDTQPVIEDFRWQLHLAVAKTEQAIGAPVHPAAAAYLADPRATVRKAFTKVMQAF